MNIIYVCSLLLQKNSSAAVRNLGLINGLVLNGHKVTVITIGSSEMKNNFLLQSNIDCDLVCYSIHSDIEKGGDSLVGKMLKYFPFLERIKKILVSLIYFPDTHKRFIDCIDYKVDENCDVIISSSDTKSSHYAGKRLSEQNVNIKWLQIWGDPWSGDVNLDSLLKRIVFKKEIELLHAADKVVYISEPTLNESKLRFPKLSSKMFSVSRSYLDLCENVSSFNISNVRFLYTGSISNGRSISDFLYWLKNLKANNSGNFNYTFNINGLLSEEQENEYGKIGNVSCNGVVSFDLIQEEFKHNDVLVFVANKEGSTQIPGKLFDYMGTNLPIVCIVHSLEEPVARFLDQFSKCKVFTFDDFKLGNVDYDSFFNFIAYRKAPEEQFNCTSIAQQIEDIINIEE